MKQNAKRQLSRVVNRSRREWWRLAEAGLSALPTASGGFRLGMVRERREKWRAAVAAYSSAIQAGAPHKAQLLARRAAVYAKLKQWPQVLEDSRAALELDPGRVEALAPMGRAYLAMGQPDTAVEMLKRGLSYIPSEPGLRRELANAYQQTGNWGKALSVYRRLLDTNKSTAARRQHLAAAAERRYLCPFELHDGKVVKVSAKDAKEGYQIATTQLREVVKAPKSPTKSPFQLARLYESAGDHAQAAEYYTQALRRLDGIDAPWVHNTRLAWRFRLDHVKELMEPTVGADLWLHRRIFPGQPADLDGIAGFFEAEFSNNGLALSGFVLPGTTHDIDIMLNSRRIASISPAENEWLPKFQLTILHRVVDDFPSRAVLSLSVQDRPLVTTGSICNVDVSVPGGSGRLNGLLDEGNKINKKGRFSPPGGEQADERHLDAYVEVRKLCAEQLGIDLFLCYGTLLGCYRNGDFIPGDDDLDVGYVSRAEDPAGMKREAEELMLALARHGYDTRVAIDGRPFHLRVGDVRLDINPMWFYEGRAWSFRSHQLTREQFAPVQSANLLGREVYIPRDTEAFLADNYGPDWQTPQPGFRYYRDPAELAVLRLARLNPSEVEKMTARAEQIRRENPAAGRFFGYADPNSVDFG
ncbi:tetratricopeptide repeat protein [Stackebrandtia albiflava]|uniref:Tetratricopeptide repeat protein n=1 Tax=Stackebrandtia albiflava TaxID=406432 RepID=A0A562V395_9ACTN|nr:tetratricopeptide repeat protein [Stackebrandtia albiflava]TWJ12328.1 tetratricopeptide repeat protein [Stackebrandtia albiflava]